MTGPAGGWSWLGTGGAMASAVAELDWSRTPLGAPEKWPASLRTALAICLSSRFPMLVWWGPELVQFYNDAYVPALGAKHPAALGQRAAECWAEAWPDLGPLARSVLAGEGATYSEDELLFMQRHGYVEESYWTFSYSPIQGDAGGVGGIFIAVNDTTDRILSERRLRVLRELGEVSGATAGSAEAACRAAVDVLARHRTEVPFVAVYLRDGPDVRLAAASGLVPGSAVVPEAVPEGRRGRSIQWVATGRPAILRTGLAADYPDSIYPSVIGDAVPTDALIVPLLTPAQPDPVGALVVGLNPYRELDAEYRAFVDLVAHHVATTVADALAYAAERRRAEALAELDRAKTDFFSNVSHEFRTPLTLIAGPMAQLRGAPAVAADPGLAEEVEVAHRNALRLGRLVDSLLDFSRLQAGRARARFEPLDLGGVTTELASMFRAATDRAGLALHVDCPPLGEPVHVDREMWEKVVLNLLSNAVKFTFTGSVSVRVRRDGDAAVLEVADTGIGIPAAELGRLFERFHQVPGVRGRSAEGSGIGLALAGELLALHGGTLTARSTVDAGSTFTARIPLGHQHLPPDQVAAGPGPDPATGRAAEPFVAEALRWLPDAPEDPPPAPAGGARILVADDNADMREYLVRLLAEHTVTAVPDGAAALAAARADPPDLVLTDAMMPGLDGFALVAALRAEPRLAGVPVLVVSARAGPEATLDGLAAGADDYLVKPFAAAELTARVRAQLQLARVRRGEASRRAALIAALQDGLFVADDERRIVEVNEAFETILGYGQAGVPYAQPYPWWPDPGTEDRALVEAAWAELDDVREMVVPLRHRDGRRVWVSAVCSPFTDPESGRAGFIGTLRDVTAARAAADRAQELATEQLRAADEAHRLLADADDVVSRHAPDGTYRYVSPSVYRVAGWLPEQLVGRDALDFVHAEDRDVVRAAIEAFAAGPGEVLLRFRRADGEYRWVRSRGWSVPDERTGEVELRTVSRDVHSRVLAEQELERFRAVAERTSDLVGIAGADARALWLNPAGRRLLGWDAGADVAGLPVADTVTAASARLLADEVLPTAHRQGVWSGELELTGADGEPIPVSLVFIAHRDRRGELAYYSTVARDLRPQRAAEARLHAEQERNRTLLTQVPVGIFLTDAAGRNLFVNDWLREVAGDTGAGRGWTDHIHPEDRAEVVADWARAVAAGEEWGREYRAVTGSGATIWLSVTLVPLRDADGRPTGYLGTALDVTARRDAERARAQVAAERAAREVSDAAAARLDALVGGLAAAVWEADARTGEIRFVSERVVELLGYPVEHWLGDRGAAWRADLHADDLERVVTARRAAVRAGRDHGLTYRMCTADRRSVWVHDLVHVAVDGDGRPRLLQGVFIDVTEQMRAEAASALLAEVGRIQATGGDLGSRLDALVRAAAPVLAELSAVVVLGADGLLRPFVAACPEHPDVLAAALDLPPVPVPGSLAERIARGRAFVLAGSGEKVLDEVVADDAELRARLALGLHDRLIVPLVDNDRTLGLLSFVSITQAPRYDPADIALAEELGRRVTLMIVADRAVVRERRLHELTAELAAAGTVADAAAAVADGVRRATGAAGVVVHVVAPDGRLRLVHSAGMPRAAGRETVLTRDADHPSAEVACTGEPLWLTSPAAILDRYPRIAPVVAEIGAQATAAVPVRAGDEVVAVFVALYATPRTFDADEREFLLTLAAQAALAFERAALADTRRDLAETLQHSLLPASLPELDRLALAARYLPAVVGVQAGGDWYDVVALDADRTAIVVGDVVGQGAQAAAVMGQLRSALSAALLLVDGPAAALAHLDRFAAGVPGALASTAVCVVLDSRAGRLRWATAGHPPPLVVDAGGARYLEGDGANPVLGVARGGFGEGAVDIAPGSTVVLYTDGLVEERGATIDDGLRRLADAAAGRAGDDPATLVGGVLGAVLSGAANRDDVAIVAARLLPAPLRDRLPARPETLAAVRRAVEDWAVAAAVPPLQLDDVQLALGEAAANAVEHAYGHASGAPLAEFSYGVSLGPGGGVAVEVVDDGRWRPPPADRGHRGRGLELIRAVGVDATVTRGERGTAVRFTVPAPDPAAAPATGLRRPAGPPGPATVRVHDEAAGPCVEVLGDVDLATVGPLRTRILEHLAGHPRSAPGSTLVLDLGATTHLASAGVRLLLELAAEARGRGMAVRVVPAAGGPVARVLALTGLDRSLRAGARGEPSV